MLYAIIKLSYKIALFQDKRIQQSCKLHLLKRKLEKLDNQRTAFKATLKVDSFLQSTVPSGKRSNSRRLKFSPYRRNRFRLKQTCNKTLPSCFLTLKLIITGKRILTTEYRFAFRLPPLFSLSRNSPTEILHVEFDSLNS